MISRLCVGLLILTTFTSPGCAQALPDPAGEVRETLRLRLEAADEPVRLLEGEALRAGRALTDYYLERFFTPAWSEDGHPRREAYTFLDILQRAGDDGLEPQHYHLRALEELLRGLPDHRPDAGRLADFDLLLSDAFLLLAAHLWQGRVNPQTIDPEWQVRRQEFDPLPALRKALEGGDVAGSLAQLLPSASAYAGLRDGLRRYRSLAELGGWPAVPVGSKLAPGAQSPRVALLRQRLQLSGDWAPGPEPTAEDLYDPSLVAAVRNFQERHGLTPDGVVGQSTLAALNVSTAERVRQIEVNLERWRWLPRDLGRRYLLVNIAAFELDLVEEGKETLRMRVVVGKPFRRTPVFSGLLTYLVLNPYWNVPKVIAVEDIAPQVRKDPGYLSRLGLRVFRGWGADAEEVDPGTVSWGAVSKKPFPYHLRQDPGPLNALGRIKFMLPNPHDVYLHDTPARELFARENRTFSSGCIRLEKALDLAAHLLQGTPLGNRKALADALQKENARSVRLPQPVPVHLLYWTAWVDERGRLQLRPDIYQRDGVLAEALAQGPPVGDGG